MAEQPQQLSMDDILSDKPVSRETPKEPVQVETKEPVETKEEVKVERPLSRKAVHRDKEQLAQGRVRDPETGQFSPKVEPEEKKEAEPAKETKEPVKELPKVAAPQQDLTDKEKAFLRGMQEERVKRQDLERRLAAVEAAKPKTETTEAPKTFWDDPEAAQARQMAEVKAETDRIRAEFNTWRLNLAEYGARQKHPDFEEKTVIFGDLLKTTPGLYQEWMTALDPAEFAYTTGKNHQELKNAGSIDELRAKIEKETRIKLEAELKEKAEKLQKERDALPPSLSDTPSKGVNRVTWGGPPSMEEILKG